MGFVARSSLFVLLSLPFAYLVMLVAMAAIGASNTLGADPPKALVLLSGEWAIRMILVALAVSPLARLTARKQIVRARRMVGLFAFFYVSVHFTAYLVFLLELRFGELLDDVIKRPYITVGFLAWLCLVPLALTSNRFAVRRLGRRWVQLHRLVYLIGILGVLHFLWLTRSNLAEPLAYALVLAILLGERVTRLYIARRNRRATAPRSGPEALIREL